MSAIPVTYESLKTAFQAIATAESVTPELLQTFSKHADVAQVCPCSNNAMRLLQKNWARLTQDLADGKSNVKLAQRVEEKIREIKEPGHTPCDQKGQISSQELVWALLKTEGVRDALAKVLPDTAKQYAASCPASILAANEFFERVIGGQYTESARKKFLGTHTPMDVCTEFFHLFFLDQLFQKRFAEDKNDLEWFSKLSPKELNEIQTQVWKFIDEMQKKTGLSVRAIQYLLLSKSAHIAPELAAGINKVVTVAYFNDNFKYRQLTENLRLYYAPSKEQLVCLAHIQAATDQKRAIELVLQINEQEAERTPLIRKFFANSDPSDVLESISIIKEKDPALYVECVQVTCVKLAASLARASTHQIAGLLNSFDNLQSKACVLDSCLEKYLFDSQVPEARGQALADALLLTISDVNLKALAHSYTAYYGLCRDADSIRESALQAYASIQNPKIRQSTLSRVCHYLMDHWAAPQACARIKLIAQHDSFKEAREQFLAQAIRLMSQKDPAMAQELLALIPDELSRVQVLDTVSISRQEGLQAQSTAQKSVQVVDTILKLIKQFVEPQQPPQVVERRPGLIASRPDYRVSIQRVVEAIAPLFKDYDLSTLSSLISQGHNIVNRVSPMLLGQQQALPIAALLGAGGGGDVEALLGGGIPADLLQLFGNLQSDV